IPVIWNKDLVVNEEINIDGSSYNITCVSMGNPHCVIFMDTLNNLKIEELGSKFENNKVFPDRINVEFAEIIDEKTIRMRVWERGSGETFACGTGACATAVAAVLNGYCKKGEKITIKLLGGDLKIKYEESGEVYMSGPATFVFDGNYLGDI
ncbi:diaminopimelate epimerase, partial [Clostridium sp.]|uniref:diaminopimelate epimerase n=1 Tax=Clostridium sp. TaxID=1506 RepID=UPI003F3A4485